MDGSGSVVTVNSKSPDEEGNVALTAADVGAIPDTYVAPVTSVNSKTGAVTLAAADVGAIPDTAGAVTRAKLAQDALYSPLVQKTSSYTLTANDIGKTIFSDSSQASQVRIFTLDATNNATLPIGAELAILAGNTGTTKLTVEAGIGVRGNKDGDVLSSDGITVTIPRYCMIALKKIYEKYWLITGVFEVES